MFIKDRAGVKSHRVLAYEWPLLQQLVSEAGIQGKRISKYLIHRTTEWESPWTGVSVVYISTFYSVTFFRSESIAPTPLLKVQLSISPRIW